MRDKGPIEDKSHEPLPRSLGSLQSLVHEIQTAISRGHTAGLEARLAELDQARARVFSEQLKASRDQAPMALLEMYAGILNLANQTYAQGLACLDPVNATTRSRR